MKKLADYLPDGEELLHSTMNIFLTFPAVIESGRVYRDGTVKVVELEVNIAGLERRLIVEDSRPLAQAIQNALDDDAFPLEADLIWEGYRWWLS